jgi:hypothetical protein
MHQNVRKNGVVIVSNNAESETYPLPGKSPTFYITNQFCRVRYIERLLYYLKVEHKKINSRFLTVIEKIKLSRQHLQIFYLCFVFHFRQIGEIFSDQT